MGQHRAQWLYSDSSEDDELENRVIMVISDKKGVLAFAVYQSKR